MAVSVKVLKAKGKLSASDAAKFLGIMCDCVITENDLMELVTAHQIPVLSPGRWVPGYTLEQAADITTKEVGGRDAAEWASRPYFSVKNLERLAGVINSLAPSTGDVNKVDAALFGLICSESENLHRHCEYYRDSIQEQNKLITILKTKLDDQSTDLPPLIRNKPLHPNERRSVSQIIAVLASMAGLDITKPYAAAEPMKAHAASAGLELPGSDETIKKFFKMAAEADKG